MKNTLLQPLADECSAW